MLKAYFFSYDPTFLPTFFFPPLLPFCPHYILIGRRKTTPSLLQLYGSYTLFIPNIDLIYTIYNSINKVYIRYK